MKTLPTQDQPPAPAGDEIQTEEAPEGITLNELQTENEQLKAAIRLRDARATVMDELKRAGARSPKLLFEAVTGDLQFDDEGKPANTAAIVATLKTDFPEQFGTDAPRSIDAGAGVIHRPALTREALKRMKPAEIAELDWAEVKRVLAAN